MSITRIHDKNVTLDAKAVAAACRKWKTSLVCVDHRVRLLDARPYYEAALLSVRAALAHFRGDDADVPGFDTRLKPLFEPAATLADAFRIANELYANTILSPVIDPEHAGEELEERLPADRVVHWDWFVVSEITVSLPCRHFVISM